MAFNKAILPSVYFGPIQWYSKLIQYPEIVIDQHENYCKQTWRNRMRIVGPNGIQDLVIPVHVKGNHTPMREVRINYNEIWQRQHWQSIRSAYGNSPFFDYYAAYFAPFFETKKWDTLMELNSEVLDLTLRLLKLNSKIDLTSEYLETIANGIDYRKLISPKIKIEFNSKPYLQVFADRHGFVANLSIIDLLCCNGPISGTLLADN